METLNTWRAFPIFISSTFKDMHAERDYLNTFLLAKLNEEFSAYKVDFKLIDLRWGVDTIDINENEREAQVLKVCLDSVANNRPFFIALLGDRYGWIPPANRWLNVYNSLNEKDKSLLNIEDEKSVTELEILFGALGNPLEILSRSLFFFRAENSYDGMDEERKKIYQEDGDDKIEKTNKLKLLKEKIRQVCNNYGYTKAIHEYKLTWNINKFQGLEEWGQLVFENICREVKEEINVTNDFLPKNWYEQEQHKLEQFIYYQTQRFKGREDLLKKSIEFLQNNNDAKILTAFSGTGKSSFMCQLYKKLSDKENNRQIILFHSAGISQYAQKTEYMLQNWSRCICQKINLEYVEEQDDNETNAGLNGKSFLERIKTQFWNLISMAKRDGYKVILLVDALERFQQDNMSKYMQWLPVNVSLLCTTVPGYEKNPLKKYPDLIVEEMPLFSEKEAQEMLDHICELYNKELNHGILKRILQKKDEDGSFAYSSPLWLSLVGNILFGLNADDFEEINHQLDKNENEVEKIQKFFCELVDSFSANVEDLFITLLVRACKSFGTELTMHSMKYMALSQNGVREKDLSALLGESWDLLQFTSLKRWFKYLITETDERKWNFGHIKLSKALKIWQEYENTGMHRGIAEYLLTLPENDSMRRNELVYQMIKGDMRKAIVKCCIDIDDYSNSYIIDSIVRYYHNDNSILPYLSNCIDKSANKDAILYAGKLVLGLNNKIAIIDQSPLIQMGLSFFAKIDYKKCDINETRWIGEMSNQLSAKCDHIKDYENMLYFVKIQEYCYEQCTEHYKNDDSIQVFKNSLAMAYYKLGLYYSQRGNREDATAYFDKMTTI